MDGGMTKLLAAFMAVTALATAVVVTVEELQEAGDRVAEAFEVEVLGVYQQATEELLAQHKR
jgi:hypothetical protein